MASISPENPADGEEEDERQGEQHRRFKVMEPRHIVDTQLNTFTPVGTAMSMVAYIKNSSPASGMLTVNIW